MFTVTLGDKAYIPSKMFHKLNLKTRMLIKDLYHKKLHNPNMCPTYATGRFCDKYDDIGKKACFTCSFSLKELILWKLTNKYFSIAKGDKVLLNSVFDIFRDSGIKFRIKDKSKFPKLSTKMQYQFDYSKLEEPRKSLQLDVVKAWMKTKANQIVCPPRFGKSALVTILAAKSKTKVVIVIHQKELLDQFYTTFMKFTNIGDKGKILGRSLIKINPRPEEIDDISVCLFTWQQFISKTGQTKLKSIKKKFGILFLDECHHCSSDVYSSIVDKFWARYRCGVTATPTRKDGLHFRSNLILGPPGVTGGAEQLSCDYTITHTNWDVPEYKNWTGATWNHFWTRLCKDNNRNKLIAECVELDVKNGYKVIIPVKRVLHTTNIIEYVDSDIKSVAFVSSVKNRGEVTKDIRKGKYDLVVATKQLISEGFDCPPMSCIYLNCGAYSFDVNSLYQEYSRIRTEYKGKNKPLIRIFYDNGKLSDGSIAKIKKELRSKKFNLLDSTTKKKNFNKPGKVDF